MGTRGRLKPLWVRDGHTYTRESLTKDISRARIQMHIIYIYIHMGIYYVYIYVFFLLIYKLHIITAAR